VLDGLIEGRGTERAQSGATRWMERRRDTLFGAAMINAQRVKRRVLGRASALLLIYSDDLRWLLQLAVGPQPDLQPIEGGECTILRGKHLTEASLIHFATESFRSICHHINYCYKFKAAGFVQSQDDPVETVESRNHISIKS
jgi:hypothetical protein